MFKITLPSDRAQPDMVAVAKAFGISIDDLNDAIHIGTISRWFEVGEGNQDNKPHQIFSSERLGVRVEVDESGNVLSSGKHHAESAKLQPHQVQHRGSLPGRTTMEETLAPDMDNDPDAIRRVRLNALLDEALDESFPASDPVAISFESPPRSAPPSKKYGND